MPRSTATPSHLAAEALRRARAALDDAGQQATVAEAAKVKAAAAGDRSAWTAADSDARFAADRLQAAQGHLAEAEAAWQAALADERAARIDQAVTESRAAKVQQLELAQAIDGVFAEALGLLARYVEQGQTSAALSRSAGRDADPFAAADRTQLLTGSAITEAIAAFVHHVTVTLAPIGRVPVDLDGIVHPDQTVEAVVRRDLERLGLMVQQ